jgi:hypothetical protein
MKNTSKRLEWVLNGLESRGVDFSSASEYGEPGYTSDFPVILFANWNGLEKSAMRAVESVAEIEWIDEWVTDDRGRAFRHQPDCYGWEPSFFEWEGEIIPWDTLPESGEDLANALRDYGFTAEKGDSFFRVLPSEISTDRMETIATLATERLESGFHAGQNDTPEKALKSLPDGTYVFRITGKGQFDTSFEAWKLNKEGEEA